jgi:hypothetical protein
MTVRMRRIVPVTRLLALVAARPARAQAATATGGQTYHVYPGPR